MVNNLENIPALLRIIAREIESGKIDADVGVLTLRKSGAARPKVFGFGAVGKLDPDREIARASAELLRCADEGSGEQMLPES